MRICMISREFPPETHTGGIGTYTYKTSATLAKMGHEVHVITASQKPAAEYSEQDVLIHRIQSPVRRRYAPHALMHAQRVADAISRIPSRLDIVQACEWGGEAFWYAVTPDRRAPLVTRLATPLYVVERLNETAPKRRLGQGVVTHTMERMQTIRSDGIFSPTRALARIVSEGWHIAPERISVVPTGAQFDHDAASAAFQHPPTLPEIGDSPYVLYFGRLEPRKGVHILGAALPAVLDAHPLLKAVFIGEDLSYEGRPMADAIRARCARHADRLVFLPRMPQRDLFPLVRAARLVVLPSLWENLANTCLEAMQLGRPVVATWGCGFEEVIEDGVSGFLAPANDVDALAARMLDALSNFDYAERVGKAAERRAAEFGLDEMALRLVAYYERLLASDHAPQALAMTGTNIRA